MIIPRTRLILWTALIVLPFAAVAPTVPGAWPVSIFCIGGLAVVVIADALLAPPRLAGLRVALPELVRLQKDQPGTLDVHIHHESPGALAVRIGLAFPPEIASSSDDRITALADGVALSRLEWPVTPARRGQYFLDRAYLEVVSPLGFWAARKNQPARAELRVYPDLQSERKHVAALFLRRGALGSHAQRQAGQGREFEKLREYVPGDSYDEIHWKASAKRGHPVTKVFQIERTQEVYLILDASRLSARSVEMERGSTTALERFVTAALILGAAAERQGDQFGLLTFSDRVLSFVRAKNGQAHYDACRDRLYTLQPQSVTPDFAELCAFIRLRLRKRALLIFLTALDDPMLAESFSRSVELICRQHLVLVNMLKPAGAEPLFSDTDIGGVDDIYRKLGGHLRWRELRELEKVLRRRGVRFSLLDAERIAGQVVAQHADTKRRQLL
jgi:uncharacterized protein (DUF58 family)